ncbi:hypothetical protein ZEAMMB73_Zm00001d022024 [Zea mays]|uniref:Uncharacterized protein n=1 Tax=Zea mays TaxID=4577 RepID=A0A1D6IIL3_MAIZE|nr:hypothetical protein ZEAMMB73_Zm00001d022024 [Zea mays]
MAMIMPSTTCSTSSPSQSRSLSSKPPPFTMGFLDALYHVVMRRNAVYVTFVVIDASAGEQLLGQTRSQILDLGMGSFGLDWNRHASAL